MLTTITETMTMKTILPNLRNRELGLKALASNLLNYHQRSRDHTQSSLQLAAEAQNMIQTMLLIRCFTRRIGRFLTQFTNPIQRRSFSSFQSSLDKMTCQFPCSLIRSTVCETIKPLLFFQLIIDCLKALVPETCKSRSLLKMT